MTTQALSKLTKPLLVERVAELTERTREATERQLAAGVLGALVGLLLGAALF